MRVVTMANWLGGCALSAVLCTAGCQSSSAPRETASDRQDAALRDPFSYGSNWDNPDITRGGITEYNDKAMKKDMDDVLNP